MKKFLLVSLMITLLPLFAFGTNLLPASHYKCLNLLTNSCARNTEFYVDQDGRCGCLRKNEVIPKDICERARIVCDEDRGQSFSSMYQIQNMCGLKEKEYVGCGCYFVSSNRHPN